MSELIVKYCDELLQDNKESISGWRHEKIATVKKAESILTHIASLQDDITTLYDWIDEIQDEIDDLREYKAAVQQELRFIDRQLAKLLTEKRAVEEFRKSHQ